MSEQLGKYTTAVVADAIMNIRNRPVILDADLARIYGASTKALNQAVKRNLRRFPSDFVFQLSVRDLAGIRSQSVTASRRNIRHRPYAFTEHGSIMAAMILNSPRAVQMSVFVVRAFVKMRSLLAHQKGLARKLADLEKRLTERVDVHERVITDIIQQIVQLLTPPPPEPEPPKRGICFHVSEKHLSYRVHHAHRLR